jgi:hypothetical protein
MSTKFIAILLLIIGLGAATMEGLPQRGWEWFTQTEVGLKFYSLAGGNEHLSGPLRGALDSLGASELTREGIANWTNTQRSASGLIPLHVNPELNKAAESKLNDMFEQQYFEHESPDGKSPADVIKATGYAYIIVGENLALGNFKNDEILVQAWMDSPGHRANILNKKFQEIGTAARKATFEGKEVWLAVQEFGTPLSFCPSPGSSEKLSIDHNRSEIALMQSDLQSLKSDIDANRFNSEEEYNRAVAKYNSLAERLNKLADQTQNLVTNYNENVNEFNKCLESNT